MIDKREILDSASARSLRPDVVEKDYALGWMLAGIGQHRETSNTWVFKGGTCRKSASLKPTGSRKISISHCSTRAISMMIF